jgi:broad specificity phosphatase PhoE
MVTTLYLMRHGETEGNGAKRYLGAIDAPLSREGEEQVQKKAGLLSEHLSRTGVSRYLSYLRDIHGSAGADVPSGKDAARLQAVYCSSLGRAIRSAEILASHFGLSPIIDPALRERSFGIWDGMSFSEIRERYPEEFSSWARNPLKYSPIGGETTNEVRDRAIRSTEKILQVHRGQSIAVLAHGGINRIILCHVLGMPLENIFRIEQDHAAINIIEFWEQYPVLTLLNG